MNPMEGMGTSQPMLSGLGSMSPPMFNRIMPDFTPDPEEMDQAAQRVQFDRISEFTGVHSETFDLSRAKQNAAYEKLMAAIFVGLQAKTHVILFSERKFVGENATGPRWLAHIEWAEFKLKKTAVEPIKSASGDNNGKESPA